MGWANGGCDALFQEAYSKNEDASLKESRYWGQRVQLNPCESLKDISIGDRKASNNIERYQNLGQRSNEL